VFSWAVGLRGHTSKRDKQPLAARTVWNTFSTVRLLLDDAVEMKRLKTNPLATFKPDKYLPEKADKRQDGWRETAGFDLEQVVSLTRAASSRSGAGSGTRSRSWSGAGARASWPIFAGALDRELQGRLGRLVIASAYSSREKKEKATKTGAKKLIPVHPFAAGVLKAWHDAGWKKWMDRDPKPRTSSSRAQTASSSATGSSSRSSTRTSIS